MPGKQEYLVHLREEERAYRLRPVTRLGQLFRRAHLLQRERTPAWAVALAAVLYPGEPDAFVPGFGWEAELSLTRFLGVWAGGAYFLSGTWDLETGLWWHLSPQFTLSLQALFPSACSTASYPSWGPGRTGAFP